jgi:hypothetical protein
VKTSGPVGEWTRGLVGEGDARGSGKVITSGLVVGWAGGPGA